MLIHLDTLGCRLNEAELQAWAHGFRIAGHEVVDDAAGADMIVLNTCAVTAEAMRKSRQAVRRLRRRAPAARLVVTGCYSTLEPAEAAAALGADLVVGNRDKDRLVELVGTVAPAPVVAFAAVARLARGRSRAFVKIQDGCRYRCTFCIVTVARGEERSRPLDEVVDEVARLHDSGVAEVVLTGVHVGGYGSDTGDDLARLVEAILAKSGIRRLRMASVEPWDLPDGFFDLYADPRLMPHLHLPLQSGSDRVLRRMARRCRTDTFRRLLELARRSVPDFGVTTDIIAGFPGETAEAWAETVAFVEEVGFADLHVFPYSPRAGTKAAAMDGQVPVELRRARVAELKAVAARLKRHALERHVGRTATVLWEGAERARSGYTPNYLRVCLDEARVDLVGTLGEARLTGITADGTALRGELVEAV